jgi:hypothetical protein
MEMRVCGRFAIFLFSEFPPQTRIRVPYYGVMNGRAGRPEHHGGTPMDTHNITAEMWRVFEKRFPAAYSHLIYCSLLGELQHLRALGERRTEWQDGRFTELKRWWHDQHRPMFAGDKPTPPPVRR